MKKLIILAAAAGILAVPVSASADTSLWIDDDIMPLLNSLGIMQGDGSGGYALDRPVSRAEMAKIAVNTSSHKDETAIGMSVSPFKDVPSSSWFAPYILNGATNGLFKGFVDGSFHPDDTVTYEDATAIMLRVLGYSDDNFGASYPYGQVNFAKNINLLDNVEGAYGDTMTRGQIARMVYNTLNTDMADKNSKLLSIFDAEVIEDVVITEVPNGNSGKVSIGSAKYNIYDGFDSSYLGLTGDIVVRNSADLLCFVPEDRYSEEYIVYSILNNTVIGYNGGIMSEIDLNDDTVCYKNNSKTVYSAIRNSMEMGDVLNVKKSADGSIDYCLYEKGKLEGPVKLVSGTGFNTDSATQFMRDGNKTTESGLQENDIVYYSPQLNMVMAYSYKVSGIYQDASPSRDNPATVTISGKEYKVEGVSAYNDLSSSGSFKLGDTITVCLGKDGESIAGVVSSNSSAVQTLYGYVTNTGKKSFNNPDGTTYSSYYVDVVSADGIEYEYAVKSNPADYKGSVVKVSLSSNGSQITSVQGISLTGYVDVDNRTINGIRIADDCKILDTGGRLSSDEPIYKKLYLQRLEGMNINSGTVSYYHKNSYGEIDELILSEATGDCYSYGIAVSVNSGASGGSCSVEVNGNIQSASVQSGAASTGSPCKIRNYNGQLTVTSKLKSYPYTTTKLSTTSITIGNTEYKLSDEVAVYEETSLRAYNRISINDAVNGDYIFTAYYDKAEENGGRVRVITAVKRNK